MCTEKTGTRLKDICLDEADKGELKFFRFQKWPRTGYNETSGEGSIGYFNIAMCYMVGGNDHFWPLLPQKEVCIRTSWCVRQNIQNDNNRTMLCQKQHNSQRHKDTIHYKKYYTLYILHPIHIFHLNPLISKIPQHMPTDNIGASKGNTTQTSSYNVRRETVT